jgi:predicted regulator of Ras-like GTPase activity (Roadblock/LC7/MglB family)
MDAVAALAELKDLSTQIEVVVLAYRSGEVQASTVSGQTAVKLGRLAADIVEHADQVRRDLGREGVAQLQAATPEGSLFIVLDGDLMALATTAPDPTAGLVFYDLKTLLRQLDDRDDQPVAEVEEDEVTSDSAGEAEAEAKEDADA